MAGENPSQTPPASRLRILGLAMIAAAVWRGWPDARELVESIRWQWGNLGAVAWFDHLAALWAAWPLVIGVALVVGQSPRLLKAAIIACLALGVERLIFLGVGLFLDARWGWSTGPQVASTLSDVVPKGWGLVLPVASAAAWLALGFWSFRMDRARRRAIVGNAPSERAIRGAVGRVAALLSLIFAMAIVGNEGWDLFLEVLQRFPSIRKVVLRANPNVNLQRALTPAELAEEKQFRDAAGFFRDGYRCQREGKFREAWETYAAGLNLYEKLARKRPTNEIYTNQVAQCSNNLAWFLVTWPDASKHVPEAALPLARRAVTIDPMDGNAWNTLGVVLYRSGDLQGAFDAFENSKRYRRGGDAFDTYFLAMIETKRKRDDLARFYYDEAVAWSEKYRPEDPELIRFRAEAATLMGIPLPPPKTEEAKAAEGPTPRPAASPVPSIVQPQKGFGRGGRGRGR